jgi:hypothetical protein
MATMDRIVCYVPSYNDSALVAHSLATVPEWDVVISDNASDEPHRAALDRLAGPRVQVIHQPRQLGRVGNWKFCVAHFIASGATWMKLLPAGDRHKPDSLAACHRAVATAGDARLVVVNLDLVAPEGTQRWSPAHTTLRLPPAQAMLEAAARGNIFYSLLTNLIHVDAVREGFSFAEDVLSYCADLFFDLNIARRTTTLFYPEPIVEFVAAHRKTFRAHQYSLEHVLEEALVRLRAADYYAQLSGDRQTRDALMPRIASWLRGGLAQPPEQLLGGSP